MLLKGKQFLFSLIAVLTLIVVGFPIQTVLANNAKTTVTTSNVEGIASKGATFSDGTTYDPNGELPEASINQATDWADRKGEDATHFLQVGGQWLAIIVFIISAVMTLFGAIAGKVSKGLIGIFIAILMYTGITFAPLLIDFISQWLAS